MKFLVALSIAILEKVIAWIFRIISREKLNHDKKLSDEKKAQENEKKVELSQDDLDRHKKVEDLLNGQ